MDYLIDINTSAITQSWGGSTTRVVLPNGDTVFPGDARPQDIGDHHALIAAVVINDPFDPAAHKAGAPDIAVDAVARTVTVTTPAVAMTPQEIADRDTANDIAQLQARGKDAALVLVELVDWLLANTAMTRDNLSANVKVAYLSLKPIADRVKQ